MFKIKPLLSYEANFNKLTFPIAIEVKCDQIFRNDASCLWIVLTKKNTVHDLSAIIKRLLNINVEAKSKQILVTSVQHYVDLVTGNDSSKIFTIHWNNYCNNHNMKGMLCKKKH